MKLWDIVLMALRAIAKNKVRAFLTALGVVIGVASVIAMVHLGQAATMSVTQQISNMGSNLLIVRPGGNQRGPDGRRVAAKAFDEFDVAALSRDLDGAIVAPTVSSQAVVVYGNANYTAPITGTNNYFFKIRSWELSSGRVFEDKEIASGSAVCILGKTIVDNLYMGKDPIGSAMRVGTSACQVVGVLESKGQSMGQDQDELVIMPMKAVQRRLVGRLNIQSVYVSALVDGTTPQVQAQIESILRQRRGIRAGEEDDFNVRDMQEVAQALEGVTMTLTALLGAIAAVSLLVGGIGIMNIMLVSVTERTREIGIRLAIGALARDVMLQFLVEAMVLSTLGGALGVGVGLLATWALVSQMSLPMVFSTSTIALAFGFSAAIGVVFGYAPARKASHLSPIESLRHE